MVAMGESGVRRGGVSFVAIVSVNMGEGVAKLGSYLSEKSLRGRNRGSLFLAAVNLLDSHACRSEAVLLPVNTSSPQYPHAICETKHTKSDSLLERNQTKCLTRPLTKAAFHKITPLPVCCPSSPALLRALFRGGLILFQPLVVILSSVNLSFWSGITQQNIKGTLIPKMCQSSALSCNAPFPSLSFHFFSQLRKLRGLLLTFSGVDMTGQRGVSTNRHSSNVTRSSSD